MKLLLETHQLIQSLTQNEKGYFKRLQKSNKKDSKLLLAFDLLNTQKDFNEKELSETLTQKGIAKSLITHLLDTLLRSLSSYHTSSNDTLQLVSLLSNLEVMFSKKQYNLCSHVIDKGLALSSELGYQPFYLLFSQWRHRLTSLYITHWNVDVNQWYLEDQENLSELTSKMSLRYLLNAQSKIMAKEITSDKVRQDLENEILGHSAIRKEVVLKTPENIFLFHHLRIRSKAFFGNWQETLEECELLLSKIKDVPKSREVVTGVLGIRLNVIRLHAFLRNDRQYDDCRKAMQYDLDDNKFGKYMDSVESIVYPTLPIIHLCHLANKGQTEYLINYRNYSASHFKSGERTKKFLNVEVLMATIWCHFVAEEYKQCLHAIALLQSDEQVRGIEKFFHASKWLEVLCYYELSEEQLFSARWLSLSRYMTARSHDSHAVKLLLATIKKAFIAQDKVACFKQLIAQKEFRIEEVRTVMGYIDLYSWAKAKSNAARIKAYFKLD